MSRLLLNKPLWRVWVTAAIAALGITLLLTWQSYHKQPTYFVPPETADPAFEHQSDHVKDVGQSPEPPTGTPTESGRPIQPPISPSQGKTDNYGLSVEDAANATLGVSQNTVFFLYSLGPSRDHPITQY